MGIGRDLLDVPFADMVHQLALAIADGQLALDKSSIATLQTLLTDQVTLVPEIVDVITTSQGNVNVPGVGNVPYTGARVTTTPAAPVTMSLLQAGIAPSFYQFTEASIEVKMTITMQTERDTTGQSKYRARAASVDFRASNTYTYNAQGASSLKATIKPVPAPSRITPRTVTVDATTQPPRVTGVG